MKILIVAIVLRTIATEIMKGWFPLMMEILAHTNKGLFVQLSADEADLSILIWTIDANGYPVSRYEGKQIRLHRFIGERMAGGPIPKGFVVDHIDGNKLNCQRGNLRIVTHQQNMFNRKPHKNSRTGFKGLQTNGTKWYAAIARDGVRKFYGPYETPLEAARIYDEKAKELHGEYARVNKY